MAFWVCWTFIGALMTSLAFQMGPVETTKPDELVDWRRGLQPMGIKDRRLPPVYFAEGSSELNEGAMIQLKASSRLIGVQHSWKVIIEGHSDDSLSDSMSIALADNRAAAVKKFLVESGLDPRRLEHHSMGHYSPRSPERTPIIMASNRRVEFRIVVIQDGLN